MRTIAQALSLLLILWALAQLPPAQALPAAPFDSASDARDAAPSFTAHDHNHGATSGSRGSQIADAAVDPASLSNPESIDPSHAPPPQPALPPSVPGRHLRAGSTLTIAGSKGACSCTGASTSLDCFDKGISAANLSAALGAAGQIAAFCPDLTSVGFSHNLLTSVPAGLFHNLSSLRGLSLSTNDLTALPAQLFDGLESLAHLDLTKNQLVDLSPSLFFGLEALGSILLYDNKITRLQPGVFAGLASLTELNLSINQIAALGAGLFADLVRLMYLDLSQNLLTQFATGAFSGLAALDSLRLESNCLTVLPAGFGASLGSLTIIELSDNRLAQLDAPFAGMSNLLYAKLSSNRLTALAAGDFAGLGKLTSLDLSKNNLSSLHPETFVGLGALEDLELQQNLLSGLHIDLFDGLSMLRGLHLSTNRLDHLEPGLLDGTPQLYLLELSGNQISHLGAGLLTGLSLRRLKADNNLLQNVLLGDLTLLAEVDLSNNALTSLEADLFGGLTTLINIDLANNHLTRIEVGIFTGMVNLGSLRLSHNKLESLGEGLFGGLTKLSSLHLDHNELTGLPSNIFADLRILTELQMSNNRISNLPDGLFQGTDELSFLYLGNNRLTSLSDATGRELTRTPVAGDSLPTLELQVHNNAIAHIARSWTAVWPRAVQSMATFRNNPSHCDIVLDPNDFLDASAPQVVCDCATGYTGLNFCEPVQDAFIQLPPIVTDFHDLALSHPLLDSGSYHFSVTTMDQIVRSSFLVIPITSSDGSVSTAVPLYIATVRSAFQLSSASEIEAVCSFLCAAMTPFDLSLSLSLHQSLLPSHSFLAEGNQFIATEMSYSFEPPLNASETGLSIAHTNGTIVGSPVSPMPPTVFVITAIEAFSGESRHVANLTLTVVDCGPWSCSNNGSCIDDSDPFNGAYTCSCLSTFTGPRCTTALQTVLTTTASSDNALSVASGIAAGVLLAIATLVLLLLWRRRRMQQRKTFHVFISYRVEEDKALAEALYQQLATEPFALPDGSHMETHVFLDSECLELAKDWKRSFLDALEHSFVVVPIVSEAALDGVLKTAHTIDAAGPANTKPDNLLIEVGW